MQPEMTGEEEGPRPIRQQHPAERPEPIELALSFRASFESRLLQESPPLARRESIRSSCRNGNWRSGRVSNPLVRCPEPWATWKPRGVTRRLHVPQRASGCVLHRLHRECRLHPSSREAYGHRGGADRPFDASRRCGVIRVNPPPFCCVGQNPNAKPNDP